MMLMIILNLHCFIISIVTMIMMLMIILNLHCFIISIVTMILMLTKIILNLHCCPKAWTQLWHDDIVIHCHCHSYHGHPLYHCCLLSCSMSQSSTVPLLSIMSVPFCVIHYVTVMFCHPLCHHHHNLWSTMPLSSTMPFIHCHPLCHCHPLSSLGVTHSMWMSFTLSLLFTHLLYDSVIVISCHPLWHCHPCHPLCPCHLPYVPAIHYNIAIHRSTLSLSCTVSVLSIVSLPPLCHCHSQIHHVTVMYCVSVIHHVPAIDCVTAIHSSTMPLSCTVSVLSIMSLPLTGYIHRYTMSLSCTASVLSIMSLPMTLSLPFTDPPCHCHVLCQCYPSCHCHPLCHCQPCLFQPSVCSRELCLFAFQTLGVMANATADIATGAEVSDRHLCFLQLEDCWVVACVFQLSWAECENVKRKSPFCTVFCFKFCDAAIWFALYQWRTQKGSLTP